MTGAAITADLSQAAGRSFTSCVNREEGAEWTYQVQGLYKVPGTINVWYGGVLRGTVPCK